MKKIYYFLFIGFAFLFANQSIAQSTLKAVYNSRFFISNQNADSSYNAFGINSTYLHFLTLNTNLDIIKEKKLTNSFAMASYQFKVFNDSILLYVNNSGVYATVYCINKQGNGKWSRGLSLTNGMFTYVRPLLVTNSPTRYWFSGVYGIGLETYPVLFSLDEFGNFVDVNAFVSTTLNFQLYDMVKLSDGNMMAIGTYSKAPEFLDRAIAVKVNSSGKLIWTKTYNTFIDYFGTLNHAAPQVFNLIRTYQSGKIVVAGSSSFGALKISLDENGAVVHADYFKEGVVEGSINAVPLGASEFAVLSSISAPSAASSDISVKMVNTATNNNWARNYNWAGSSKDIPQTIIKTMDGGYLVSGLTDKGIPSGGTNYTSLFKVNNGGLNGCSGNTPYSAGNFIQPIYPLQGGTDSTINLCHDSTITFHVASLPVNTNFTYGTGITVKELQCINTAVSNQWLSLIFPKVVNAQLKSGGTATLSWGSANLPVGASGLATLKLEYSVDGGANWKLIAPEVPAIVASYVWSVPTETSTDCKIRILSNENSAFADTSQVSFTISPEVNPYLSILSPNGGEVLQPGSTFLIKWDAPLVTGTVKIEYTTKGGRNIFPIEAAANNTGSYSWTVPNITTDSAWIKISGLQSIYSFYSQSGYYFKIKGTTSVVKNHTNTIQLQIYPNPANEEVKLFCAHKILGIKVFALNGTNMLNAESTVINISSLTQGIYFISVQTENGTYTQKFVKNL